MTAQNGYYAPNFPYPYADPCTRSLYSVGALPPPSSESEQAQVAGELQERVVVIGVLAALAAAAVIYQTRKKR
jgi:hypothetical protein